MATKKPTLDDLVNEAFAWDTHRKATVTTCADTVRVRPNGDRTGFVQRDAGTDLWKAFSDSGYLCGMETLHDAFRAIQLEKEILNREANKSCASQQTS